MLHVGYEKRLLHFVDIMEERISCNEYQMLNPTYNISTRVRNSVKRLIISERERERCLKRGYLWIDEIHAIDWVMRIF